MTLTNAKENNDLSSTADETTRRPVAATTATTTTAVPPQQIVQSIILPPHTWITAVHKKYHHRLVGFLYPPTISTTNHHRNNNNTKNNGNVTLLEASAEKGRCLSRRGFHILLTNDVTRAPSAVSPFCRQNISWTTPVQQQITVTVVEDKEDARLALLANSIYASLSSLQPVLLTTHKVRVDVYPRTLLEDFCAHLQRAAGSVVTDDPFEGPIAMTASRSQCTVRLTVVVLLNDNDCSSCTCYWGVQQRPNDNTIIDVALNHEAHEELHIVPMDPRDGRNTMEITADGSVVDVRTPLCRAYYKLHQVWYDVLVPNHRATLTYAGLTALDLGASPGGWTQILVDDMQLGNVICVDPAIMAQRVMHHQNTDHNDTIVTHVPCMIHKFWSTYLANEKQHDKKLTLSVLVCDASVLWKTLLQEQLGAHILPRVTWELPAVLILTCKLPFVTTGSVAKQVQYIQSEVPIWLTEHLVPSLGADADHVRVDWQLLHLFANSDSERTLVITMKKNSTRGVV